MNQERILLFLFGCMGTRFALAEFARQSDARTLAKIAPLAYLPAIGFLLIFAFDLRKTGAETFGEPIWWNHLRPIHAILFILFAYSASQHSSISHRFLYADVLIGLTAWIVHNSCN